MYAHGDYLCKSQIYIYLSINYVFMKYKITDYQNIHCSLLCLIYYNGKYYVHANKYFERKSRHWKLLKNMVCSHIEMLRQ